MLLKTNCTGVMLWDLFPEAHEMLRRGYVVETLSSGCFTIHKSGSRLGPGTVVMATGRRSGGALPYAEVMTPGGLIGWVCVQHTDALD